MTTKRMNLACILVTLSGGIILLSGNAQAAEGDKAQRMADAKAKLDARFKAADVDHDGRLTLGEAQAGMPRIAKAFGQIDSQGRGYVTEEEILRFLGEKLAERRGQ